MMKTYSEFLLDVGPRGLVSANVYAPYTLAVGDPLYLFSSYEQILNSLNFGLWYMMHEAQCTVAGRYSLDVVRLATDTSMWYSMRIYRKPIEHPTYGRVCGWLPIKQT